MTKLEKLEELSKKIEDGLDYEGLIQLRKQVYNVKVEMYSDEWYQKHQLLTCIKEFLDESKPTKQQQEQAIFKEFEEKGYKIQKSVMGFKNIIYISNIEKMTIIVIDTENKLYSKHCSVGFDSSLPITIQEHQLLHKLFEIWGWFNEK